MVFLALIGVVVHLVVGLPARRRDAASLRVVGVTKRTIELAAVVELSIVLGAAALAGVVGGSLADQLVVRRIRFGSTIGDLPLPDVPARLELPLLLAVAAAPTVVLLLVSSAVARSAVKGARGATL